ncbi:MAG: matrixin family metalloprotease, partial [Oscillospiraceae bacterium]|nr:matrixin family metalloprotease [Oscillospiraceae bacterium]
VSRLNSQSPANISLTYVGAGQVSNSSNVDVMVAGTDVWNSWQWATGAIATTVPASNGTFYYGYGSLPNSGTVYINYAMVVIAPDQKNMSSNDAVKTIMHELGHVYGMGHSYELNSLMSRYGVKEGKVYTYDYNEFRRMYP